VGYKFSLVLSREITDEESATLRELGCAGAVFMTDTHPTKPEITVTKMDFDDTVSPSLAEAIEAALESVKKVPDLSVPSLEVPAQPANAPEDVAPEGEAQAVDASENELEAVAEGDGEENGAERSNNAADPVESGVVSD
jgi:hypothetical protein